ncbi:MAG: class I SAM-dependent methyltransferase [Nitrospirae bacterium]|nr:class I SAM-dependent methyltransferase [Nitrospirota bacterium]
MKESLSHRIKNRLRKMLPTVTLGSHHAGSEPAAPPQTDNTVETPLYNVRKEILRTFQGGCFDAIDMEPCGLVRIEGWCLEHISQVLDFIKLYINETVVPIEYYYRVYRADIAVHAGTNNHFTGFAIEYLVSSPFKDIRVTFREEDVFTSKIEYQVAAPHYAGLISRTTAATRDDIYGSAPASRFVSDVIMNLASSYLLSPVLDFGCGSGALIRNLRGIGIEAFGIELESAAIIENLYPDIQQYVTIYSNGSWYPFEDGSFESVICTEVIEHISDFEGAVKEIARIARKRAIITVPDISAIPVCYQHNVVPWHILEATHVNFFNQSTLSHLLTPLFREVEFVKIHPNTINGTTYFNNIACICTK